jgi:hypothetical protein
LRLAFPVLALGGDAVAGLALVLAAGPLGILFGVIVVGMPLAAGVRVVMLVAGLALLLAQDRGEQGPQRQGRQQAHEAAPRCGSREGLDQTIETLRIHRRATSGQPREPRRWGPAAGQAVAIVGCSRASS